VVKTQGLGRRAHSFNFTLGLVTLFISKPSFQEVWTHFGGTLCFNKEVSKLVKARRFPHLTYWKGTQDWEKGFFLIPPSNPFRALGRFSLNFFSPSFFNPFLWSLISLK